MEPHPPPPPLSTAMTTTGPLPPPPQSAPQPHSNTSPPSRKADPCKEPPNGVTATTTGATTTTTITTATAKLRLMCSYGGHIVPRPHDKSLCYVGGDTRIVVVDRHTSLSELQFRLSKSLLNGNLFTLKYQLPTEDLDSLISVATDEDLEHMVEEYDRLLSCNNPSSKASRLRLFLFTSSFDPEKSPSIESILGGSKNQDWFFTALNWNSSAIKQRPSMNCLLGLDDSVHISDAKPGKTLIEANGSVNTGGRAGNSTQDVQSVADSPMLDTTSSFGSSSSATSITVQVEEGGANPKGVVDLGVAEQFQQMNVVKKEEEPHLEQQQVASQLQHVKPPGGSDLPSPESVTSDISVQNPMSKQNPVVYEEHTAHIQSGNGKNFGNQMGIRADDSTRMQMQQVHESGYVYPSHFDHQYQQLNQPHQFVPAHAQYIHNHQPRTLPVYYSLYPPPQQPNYRPGIEHPYPVYFMPTHPQMPPPASAGKPDLAGGVYRMPAAPAQQALQVPTTQSAPENGGFSRIYLPSQALNPPAVDYAYKFVDPANGHVYYTQPPPRLATQYQTVAPSPAATLSEVPPPLLSTEKH